MANPKMSEKNGVPFHFSVGAIIKKDDKYFLIDRKNPPVGFASVAGHVDEGESVEDALKREMKEESGFDVIKSRLIIEEFVEKNRCTKGVGAHQWYVYNVDIEGIESVSVHEVKSCGWYTKDELSKLPLEPIWEVWFKKLNII